MEDEHDARVRLAAFQWLESQRVLHGTDVLPYAVLTEGFAFHGTRVPIIGPQGIFKPAVLSQVPLSITTAPNSPYDDRMTDETLEYRYRGTDPMHRDNAGLRRAMTERIPLIYCHGVDVGRYLVSWPVYVVHDDPARLTFRVQVDAVAPALVPGAASIAEEGAELRRAYVTSTVKRRLHQEAFRERVIRAYREQCAFCRLRHRELLDAAHITADADELGDPIVTNGLSLCKLHHAAYDRHFLTVRPDYVIEVRRSILDERDGPMLLHGLKGMHEQRIALPAAPAQRPDPDRLALRYETFRRAG